MTPQERIQKKSEGYGKLAPVFLEGVKFALENQWISVEDDLPYKHKELLKTKEKTVLVITIDRYGIAEENYMIYRNDRWEWIHGVSNVVWMPIPEPPK